MLTEGNQGCIHVGKVEGLKNKPEKCQELPLTKPYTRYLKNKVSDPVLPYSWDCQRELAVDTAKQNDCINKSYNIFHIYFVALATFLYLFFLANK